jgi:general nucleoside transport system permease protein
MVWLFALGTPSGSESTFGLNTVGVSVAVDVPPLTVPSQLSVIVLAVIAGALGAVQLTRGFGKRENVILGLVVFLFVAAFLIWATRDASLNLVGLLQATLLAAVPLTLGALSGVLCERSGVINIAIEGMMLFAAFTGAIVGSAAGSLIVGLLLGVLSGALMAWMLAVLSIRYRVDQIIAGTVLNIFALGITSYLSGGVLTEYPDLNSPGRFSIITIPVLSSIPIIGPVLFNNNIFVYLTFILVFGIAFALARTRWGLRVRAVGEHPRAADTVGINPLRVRYRNVLLGGMVAGLAGAYLTLASTGRFEQEMTAGTGFIALAAMIFGRWNPIGSFGAALVFGFAQSLQTNLALLDVPIPSDFLLMAPYIVTIFVVAGVVGRARPPAADGQPYIKG